MSLLNEFLYRILVQEERKIHEPGGRPWQTDSGKWSAKRLDGTTQSGFDTEEKAIAWRDGQARGPAEKAAEKEKETASTDQPSSADDQPIDLTRDLPLANKARQAGAEKLYTQFADLLRGGDVAQITVFMQTHQVVFDERKNTFLVKSISGRQEKKIFGDGGGGTKNKKKGQNQRKLYDHLKKLGVDVQLRSSYVDPLKPLTIVPLDQQKQFDATMEEDGTIVFEGQRYQQIPTGDAVTQQTAQWRRNFQQQNGRRPTKKEKNEAARHIVVVTDAINKRYAVLRQLMQISKKNNTPHVVAVYEGDEGKATYINNLRKRLLSLSSNNQKLQTAINNSLDGIASATTEEDTVAALNTLYTTLEKSEEFKYGISSLAESLSVVLEITRGRRVILPMSGNFKACDLVSLSTDEEQDPSTMSLDQLANRALVVYSSVSVKKDRGAASAMWDKAKMSVFAPKHKETSEQLEVLTSGFTPLFVGGQQAEDKESAIWKAVGDNIDLIKKYYGLPDSVKNVNDLLKYLGNGRLECDENGVPVPSEQPKFMTRPGVNQRAYMLTHLMQLSAEAIMNVKTISQGYSSHFWGGGGRFMEVDGIRRKVKQKAEINKQHQGSGKMQRPQYLVSHNVPVESDKELLSGNPCD